VAADLPHFPGELPYNTRYGHFDHVLRAYPKTNFIRHGDLFWANISAELPTDRGYPTGPVKPGGLSDKWLSDFPNLYADSGQFLPTARRRRWPRARLSLDSGMRSYKYL
jgi:hypothetical protein